MLVSGRQERKKDMVKKLKSESQRKRRIEGEREREREKEREKENTNSKQYTAHRIFLHLSTSVRVSKTLS